MVVAETEPCPFALVLGEFAGRTQPPFIVLHGPGPDSLARAADLRLDGTQGDLAALLYGADVQRLDLLWLSRPDALLGWDMAYPGPSLLAWDGRLPTPPGVTRHLASAGYRMAALGPALVARRAPSLQRAGDGPALLALAARLAPAEALPLLRLLAPVDPVARHALVTALTEAGEWADALHFAAGYVEAGDAMAGALAGFNQCITSGDLAGAERLVAAMAEFRPDNRHILESALACNRQLGHAARSERFADALLALEPDQTHAHLVRLGRHVAAGDRVGELASRTILALSPPDAIHPLRRLHEAHRAISLHMLAPLDAARRGAVQALVAAAREVDPMALPEGETRHWARHYRHLSEAADVALLKQLAVPIAIAALHRARGRPLTWAGLRRQIKGAKAAFVVAADEVYLRLYGRAYLTSVLRHAGLPSVIIVHVIGGQMKLAELIRLMDLDDQRIFYTADDFAPAAVTTQCHEFDGPCRLPVAHFQCTRFAITRRVMQELHLPVFVSDIDTVLQRGVGELLSRFEGCDVVLNRNEASDAFGSHLIANLLLTFPTEAGLDFLARLQGCVEAALAGPHVTRWIDQCALQACWNASPARFGWFDTEADINNLMYRAWEPTPFLFLCLFHGFDMSTLPLTA